MTASFRWTSADLLNLREDGKLREIIDGKLLPGFAVPIDRLFLGIPFGGDGDE
jgi:hypothetical protein